MKFVSDFVQILKKNPGTGVFPPQNFLIDLYSLTIIIIYIEIQLKGQAQLISESLVNIHKTFSSLGSLNLAISTLSCLKSVKASILTWKKLPAKQEVRPLVALKTLL